MNALQHKEHIGGGGLVAFPNLVNKQDNGGGRLGDYSSFLIFFSRARETECEQ